MNLVLTFPPIQFFLPKIVDIIEIIITWPCLTPKLKTTSLKRIKYHILIVIFLFYMLQNIFTKYTARNHKKYIDYGGNVIYYYVVNKMRYNITPKDEFDNVYSLNTKLYSNLLKTLSKKYFE